MAQGTADLVILARVGLVTRRIEVLVARGTSGPLDAPLVASRPPSTTTETFKWTAWGPLSGSVM